MDAVGTLTGSGSLSWSGYRFHSELGSGTQSVVYKAWDTRLPRWVALKVMRAEFARDPERRRSFLGEARKAVALEHENIPKVFAVGEEAGLPYIAYQFVDGESMAERLKRGRIGPSETLRLILPVAIALDHAHAKGFFHGDVKPSNILVSHAGSVYLTDFGMAGATGGRGEAGGTLEYMAPELFNGHSQSVASDVYALGVTAFELLTGQTPFVGNVNQLAMAHGNSPLPFAPGINRCVFSAIQKAMAKQPQERWKSAGVLAQALDCHDVPAWLKPAGLAAAVVLVFGLWWLLRQVPVPTRGSADEYLVLPTEQQSGRSMLMPLASTDSTELSYVATDTPPPAPSPTSRIRARRSSATLATVVSLPSVSPEAQRQVTAIDPIPDDDEQDDPSPADKGVYTELPSTAVPPTEQPPTAVAPTLPPPDLLPALTSRIFDLHDKAAVKCVCPFTHLEAE